VIESGFPTPTGIIKSADPHGDDELHHPAGRDRRPGSARRDL